MKFFASGFFLPLLEFKLFHLGVKGGGRAVGQEGLKGGENICGGETRTLIEVRWRKALFTKQALLKVLQLSA